MKCSRALSLILTLVFVWGTFLPEKVTEQLVCRITGQATEVRELHTNASRTRQPVDDCCDVISDEKAGSTEVVRASCCDLRFLSSASAFSTLPGNGKEKLPVPALFSAQIVFAIPPFYVVIPDTPLSLSAPLRAPPLFRPDSPRAPPLFS